MVHLIRVDLYFLLKSSLSISTQVQSITVQCAFPINTHEILLVTAVNAKQK